MDDLRLALICGTDIPIPKIGITLCQPKIKSLSMIGEANLFSGIQCLTISKNLLTQQDSQLIEQIDNFEILMAIMKEKEGRSKKNDTIKLLSLLFPQHKAIFTPNSLLLQNENEVITIDKDNFFILQPIFKEIFCVSNADNQQLGFNPANKKAQEIADKLMKGRQRVAQINGTDKASIFAQYLSSLSIGLGIPINNLIDLTMYQLYDMVERYQLYASWDIDIRSRLAGAQVEEKPINWMKNIH